MSLSNKKSILVVGTVRNVEKSIFREIQRCKDSLTRFDDVFFHLIESDSTDSTLVQLESLKKLVPNFSYTTLGNIEFQINDRLERLRYCRNQYVEYIRALSIESQPLFVLVTDLDGMNSALTSKSIDSCFVRDDWDVVTANQTFGYYDILALRHPIWQKDDYTIQLDKRRKEIDASCNYKYLNKLRKFIELDKLKYQFVYSKMIRIKKNSEWIQVDSGYGGAAIYRTEVFLKYDYSKEFDNSEADSVTLHRKLVRNSGRIFINPKFINSHFNTYNCNRYFLIRALRGFIWRNNLIYSSNLYKTSRSIFHKIINYSDLSRYK
jgi:hypothetical protein